MSKEQTFPCLEQDRTTPFDIVIQRTGSIMIMDKCAHCERTLSRSLSDKLNRTGSLGDPILIEFKCECGAKPWHLTVRLFLRAIIDEKRS